MRQNLLIFAVIFLLIIALIGLNAVSYTQKEKTPDSELAPNRSTFNSGTTGTQAFYTLLSETGRKVMRWQEPISELSTEKRNKPGTFVVIGRTRREFTDIEATKLLEWVADGGKLVLIDREPPAFLVTTTAQWHISVSPNLNDGPGIAPTDQKPIAVHTAAAKPVQPTVFTKNVNAVQRSRFASSIGFKRIYEIKGENTGFGTGIPQTNGDQHDFYLDAPPPAPVPRKSVSTPAPTVEARPVYKGTVSNGSSDTSTDTPSNIAPVIHLAADDQNLVVDVPYGAGQIVFLADPFVVANGGINLVDNAQLAINIVAAGGGLIAFDEYHQGYGSNNNRFLEFFSGTPVVSIFLQFVVLAVFVLFSQSRRFGRALPEAEPNRLSKLEYVSAMAELQQRTNAFDLAIESIYTDFRRRTAKLFGVDNTTIARRDLAAMIAERIKAETSEIDGVMSKCEDIMYGEPTNRKETLRLSRRLREIENALGLKRSRMARI